VKRWIDHYLRHLAFSPLAGSALIALAVVNVVVLIWLVQAMFADAKLSSGTAQSKPAAVAQPERSVIVPKPPSAYQATLNRPVFFKTRQPYVTPPPPPPPASPSPPSPPQIAEVTPPAPPPPLPPPDPELALAGVIITAGVKRVYLIPRGNPTEGSWIAEGEEIHGWRVNAISNASVALQSSGRTVELLLYESDYTNAH
jgi:hypothetical protein